MPDKIGVEVVAVGIAAFSRAMRTAQEDLERTTNSIKKSSGATASFGTALTNLGGNMQRIGRAMTIGITAPLGILTGTLLSAGATFESSFAGIGKTVDGISVGFEEIKNAAQRELGITITTIEEARDIAGELGMAFGDLTPVGQAVRDEFRQMGLEVPIATDELASLGEVVGQLGVESDEIAGVTELISNLGVATDLSSEKAAFGLIRMANIMGTTVGPNAISMEEFIRRAGSALVDLGNKSVATEGEILEFAQRLSNAGKMAGWSEQEVLGWATTLADLGAKAQSGGTAVSRAITEMILAVETGSDNLNTFSKVMGMTNDQFVQFFKEDASQALAVFTQKLTEGIPLGQVSADMLTEMGLGGVRAFDVIGRLGDAQEILAKNTANANKAWEEAIALQNEAEKRTNTLKSQIQILKNTFTDLGIEIFDLVEGDIKNLIGYVKDAINWFKGLDDGIKRNVVIFAALAAVIGPLLIVMGSLISFLGMVATGIAALGVAAIPIIAILGTLIAAAGAAVGLSIAGQTKQQKQAQPATAPSADQGRLDYMYAAEPVQTPLQLFLDEVGFNKTLKEIQGHAAEISDAFLGLGIPDIIKDSGVLESFSQLKDFIFTAGLEWLTTTFDNIRTAAGGFTEALTTIIEAQGPNLEDLFSNLQQLGDELGPMFEAIGLMLNEVFGNPDWERVGKTLGIIAGLSFEFFIKGLTGIVLWARIAVLGIKNFSLIIAKLQPAMLGLAVRFSETVQTIKEKFNELKDKVANTISTILEAFENFKGEVANKVQTIIQAIIQPFQNLYEQLIKHSIITDMLADILQAFIGSKDNILRVIGELVQGVIGAFANVGSKIAGGITNLLSGGGGGAQPGAATPGAEGEGGGAPTVFSVQQLRAMQGALLELQDAWAGFNETVTITLDVVNQTLATLTGITSKLFTNMAVAFKAAFVIPTEAELEVFKITFTATMTMLGQTWRLVALGMVKSTLDFVANSLALLGQFSAGFGQIMDTVKNKGQGSINDLGNYIDATFAAGGTANRAFDQFGTTIANLGPKFGGLKGAVRGFVSSMIADLLKICQVAKDVQACVTSSPELALQHPFELFEKYLKQTSYGDLVSKSLSMPQLENVTTFLPQQTGNTTTIDRSINQSIEGLPIDNAENLAEILLRQIRMAEVLQGS